MDLNILMVFIMGQLVQIVGICQNEVDVCNVISGLGLEQMIGEFFFGVDGQLLIVNKDVVNYFQ